jgi:hypothetical protein
MPFTPFHAGPGAAIKAIAPRHFSFTVFCFAQIATDCETAYYMVQGMYPWHRFFHTYIGATVVGLGSLILGRPLCQFALRVWAAWPDAPFKRHFPSSPVITLGSAFSGAFIGTFSHVFLDSIMHGDVTAFMPFSAANPIYGAVSVFTLHALCMLLGIFGAFYVAHKNPNRTV